MHHGDFAIAAEVGVGIGLAHTPVGSPTGMADPQVALQLLATDGLGQVCHPAGLPVVLERPGFQNRDAHGIIAPVFQSLQAVQQYPFSLCLPKYPTMPHIVVTTFNKTHQPAKP